MSKTLKGLSVEEVDVIIRGNKTLRDAADEIGVKYESLLQFRSQNMKAFKQLKAQREQGLIIEDAPVVKTKPVKTKPIKKTAAQLEVKVDSETAKALKALEQDYKALQRQRDDLEIKAADYVQQLKIKDETIESQAEQITQLNMAAVEGQQTIKDLQARVKEVEDKTLKMYDMQEKKHKTQLEHQKTKIDGQLKALEASGKSVEQMRGNLIAERQKSAALQDELKQVDERHQEAVIEYENTIRKQQERIAELEKTSRAIMPPLQIHEIEESSMTPINQPDHYASENGVDPIAFLEMQGTAEEVRGAFKINVMKYAARLGKKDAELQEVDKIIIYSERYKHYLKRQIAGVEKGLVE